MYEPLILSLPVKLRAAPSRIANPQQSARFALWNLGFRPFYLLATFFGALSVLLWSGQYAGFLPIIYAGGSHLHAHEMLFGYTAAVIAGFLLTAVRNWTGQPTPTGGSLMALALLWVAGRVLILTPLDIAAAVVNAAFPAAVAVAIAIPLIKAGNVRNYFFIGLLMLISALTLLVYFPLPQRLGFAPGVVLQLVLDVILFIMAVMGGRVIPMFTNNAIPGARATRRISIERLALGSVIVLFVADLMQLDAVLVSAVAFAAALVHGARLFLWQPLRTLGTPLVWILHAAYAWIALHLALRGFAQLGWVLPSLATHALTIGAIGGLTIGMMTRTARGHTGRPLQADRYDVAAYLLLQAAAIVRVFGGLAFPALYLATVELSGLLWASALGVYFVRYWPVLTRPRADGQPG